MQHSYIPILKTLAAEFKALKELKRANMRKLLPLFDVPRIGESVMKIKAYKDCPTVKAMYLADKARSIASVWSGRPAMLDAFHWSPDEVTETGEHILPYIYRRLEAFGVPVIPVIGYDRWGSKAYRLALASLDLPADRLYCLRLDITAIDDAAEPDFLTENIDQILSELGIHASRCIALVDFADVGTIPVAELQARAERIFEVLAQFDFHSWSTAGCSLPSTIDGAVKNPDTVGKVMRRELLVWQAILALYPAAPIAFGDYGVRSPKSNEGIHNPHTNGKIRYTIDQHFLVARGHSMQLPGKGEQMWSLAEKVMNSPHFMGPDFSWGDARIVECTQKAFKGGAAQWIEIDTNHHLVYVLAEVDELVGKVVPQAA
jgi:hypothetical protein